MSDGKLGREGHRERMREQYLLGGMENVPDHNLLELFISLIVVRKDVKDTAYDLINTFGSLENVINADPHELMKIRGISDRTAIGISLIRTINARVARRKNEDIKALNSVDATLEYCENLLSNETIEKVILITLTNDGTIINAHTVMAGTTTGVNADMRKMIELIVRDNAAGVILAHNHPGGRCRPSGDDMDYVTNFKSIIRKMSINFVDNIIVGKDGSVSFKRKYKEMLH